MFKKALAHKSNATPLKSSSRRQLVASVLEQYPALRDDIAAAEGAPGISEKDLGRALVPDGVRVANIETSAGIEGSVYLSPDGDPMWVTFGRGSKELIPTLYALAQDVPVGPLPILQIHHPLPPPLFTGAPLFLPAVRHMGTPWRLPDVGEGQLVALAADTAGDGNVSYVGVGRVVAKGGLREALGRLIRHRSEGVDRDEGKFCDIMCIIDDHLWEMGSKPALRSFPLPAPKQPLAPPPQSETVAAPSGADEVAEVAEGVDALKVDDAAAPVDTGAPLLPAEISTLLSAALLQTLSTLNPSTLPLPSSQFYSAHILPSRPAYIPAVKRDDVVIGRSEWKKLAKWMKEASKEGLIKIKESKGEVVVTGFDPQHPAVDGHVQFTTVAEDEAKMAKRAAREAAAAEAEQMSIEELWRPAGSATAFWEACGIEQGSLNRPAVIKLTFDDYITKHKLIDGKDHRTIVLDETLASAIGGKGFKSGDTLVRDEAVRRLRAGVTWAVSVGGVVKKGTLNPIIMSVKTRQGRKQVTLISGLESFGVDVDDFADELRRVCAGSASVQPLTGASPKLNLKEVLVQGSQIKLATEALLGRGIPKRWIKEAEDAKKSKR
ncbi:hypothetical protein VHUM_02491 [Vanrija humicola]|uniref:SUI1 domain-containing protein n=1 Tax=Vanrija humicola TaxID=5417 RepID=A0A7D8V0P8_VANHU|nr:hypothetical protein VHUM_02491 [Vanrija humicola]